MSVAFLRIDVCKMCCTYFTEDLGVEFQMGLRQRPGDDSSQGDTSPTVNHSGLRFHFKDRGELAGTGFREYEIRPYYGSYEIPKQFNLTRNKPFSLLGGISDNIVTRQERRLYFSTGFRDIRVKVASALRP